MKIAYTLQAKRQKRDKDSMQQTATMPITPLLPMLLKLAQRTRREARLVGALLTQPSYDTRTKVRLSDLDRTYLACMLRLSFAMSKDLPLKPAALKALIYIWAARTFGKLAVMYKRNPKELGLLFPCRPGSRR